MRDIRFLRVRMEAVLHHLRTGSPWRDLPTELGPWSSNYNFFNRWSRKQLWQKLFENLRGEADNEWNCCDATIAKLHSHAHGARGKNPGIQGIGKSRGGATSKVHVLADALGNPIHLILTPGNINDSTQAWEMLDNCEADAFIADKAYDSNAFREEAMRRGVVPIIPKRKSNANRNTTFDSQLYKERHSIENFFAKLKQNRSVATRYEKLGRNYLSLIYLAAGLIWLK